MRIFFIPNKSIVMTAFRAAAIMIVIFFAAIIYQRHGLQLHAFGKNKITYHKYDWQILTTTHLKLYYPKGFEELAVSVAQIGEEAVVALTKDLRHDLSERVPVIFYPRAVDFQNTNIIPQMIGEGTGGFTELLRRRVVIPFNGSMRDLRHVLTHEMVHAFQFDIMLGHGWSSRMGSSFMRVPLWVMEGMAEFYSLGWDASVDMTMRDAIYNDALPNLAQMTRLRVPTVYSIYKLGQSFIYFAAKQYGRGSIAELIKNFRDVDGDLDDVFRQTFHKNFEQMDKEWRRWLKRRYWPAADSMDFYDEGKQNLKTNHLEKYATYNFKPSISPNGDKVAFFSNYNFYTHIAIGDLSTDTTKEDFANLSRVVYSYQSDSILYLDALGNKITWGKDNATILFKARSGEKDFLIWYNVEKNKTIRRRSVGVSIIKYPHWYPDRGLVLFIGMDKHGSSLYVYDIAARKTIRLLADPFDKKEPVFLDQNHILFAANYNASNHLSHRNFRFFVLDVSSGWSSHSKNAANTVKRTVRQFISGLSPDIFEFVANPVLDTHAQKLYFSARKHNISNIYSLDLSKMIGQGNPALNTRTTDKQWIKENLQQWTNTNSGAFFPAVLPQKNQMLYNAYFLYGYDILWMQMESKANSISDDTEAPLDNIKYTRLQNIDHHGTINNYTGQYNINPDIFMLALGYSKYGLVGFAQTNFSEMLGNNEIFALTEFSNSDDGVNFQINYANKEQRIHWDLGAFRKKNLFNVITLTNLNEIFHDAYFGTTSLYMYGGFLGVSYPVTRFFRADMRFQSSRHEEKFFEYYHKTNVMGNLHQVTGMLVFDNVLWGPGHPMDGWRLYLLAEQSVRFGPQDIDLTRIEADIRRYFFFFYRYSFAFRLQAGHLHGRDKESFLYEIGGYNTVRGHPYRSYFGRNKLLWNVEFRFPFVDQIKFAWPFPFAITGLAGVWFWDMGAAWDDELQAMYKDETRFKDIKSSFGFGLRMVIHPIIILRLDFATPWDLKEYEPMRNWRGEFSIGVDY